MRTLPFVLSLLLMGNVFAQPLPPDLEPVPGGSPDSAAQEDDNGNVPEITIRRLEGGIVQEYRINGILYMVKVTPHRGAPYFLVDTNGDGSLETRFNDLDPNLAIPAWVILSW